MPWTHIEDKRKATIVRWAYLVIVVAATITLISVVWYNKNLVNDIQRDRKRVTYDACIAQNQRNIELTNFINDVNLDKAIKQAKKEGKPLPTEPPPIDPTAKKFVNVLARYRNCDQVIMNIFGSKYNPNN